MNRITVKALFIILAACLLFAQRANANTYTAASCNQSDVQTAINSATDGDTVSVPAGSCTWTSSVNIGKSIAVIGAGPGNTVITNNSGLSFGVTINDSSSYPGLHSQWRISGFTLTGTGNLSYAILIWDNNETSSCSNPPCYHYGWRIDHMTIDYPNAGPDGIIYIGGITFGLIDHCNFTQSYEACINFDGSINTETGSTVSNLAGAYLLSLPYQPGTQYNTYIEDCAFTGTGATGVSAIDTYYKGARVVFRHNQLTNTTLYAHWTSAGNVNSLYFEVYNNNFQWNLGGSMYPYRIQGGGTGLVYNNTFNGFPDNNIHIGEARLTAEGQSGPAVLFCDGTHNWDGHGGTNPDSSAPGWPCLAQVGRAAGTSMAQIQAGSWPGSYPLYLWNNGTQNACSNPSATDGPCINSTGVEHQNSADLPYQKSTPHITSGFGNGDVDYCINASQPSGCGTHTLTYTPYTYPNPLQLTLTPPGGLRLVQ